PSPKNCEPSRILLHRGYPARSRPFLLVFRIGLCYAQGKSNQARPHSHFTRSSAMEPKPSRPVVCPDCDAGSETELASIDRRDFLRSVGTTAAVAATGTLPLWATPKVSAAPTKTSAAETAVK